jgi:pimeloyl-ACP methyl ester carboxylesterase
MRTRSTRSATLALVAVSLCTASSSAADDKYFDANGVKVRYIEQGNGEPVVLLHGIGGSVQSWVDAGVFDALAADHRVIALDARGHGKSGKPHDPKQYGREMALDVVRLLDHLAIRQAHIVGYSMGAGTTSQLLTLHPERFLTATLAAGAGRLRPLTADDDRLNEQEAAEREKECVSRSLINRLAPPNAAKPSEEAIKKLSAACLANPDMDRFAIAAVTRSRRGTVVPRERAAAVSVPTLGIVGTLDPARAGLEDLKSIRPTLQLVYVEGAVHGSAAANGLMRARDFVSTLRAFITSRGQRTTSVQ